MEQNKVDGLPEGWKIAKLKDIGDIITGSTPPKSNPNYYGGGIPFVKPPYLGKSEPIFFTEETLSEDGLKRSRVVPANSILVCCIGSL